MISHTIQGVTIIEYDNRTTQVEGLTDSVAQQLTTHLKNYDRAALAVPGGTTPAAFLTKLSQVRLSWDSVLVSLTDERQVPEDHERSNALLLKRTLLQNEAKNARFVPLYTTSSLATDQALAGLRPLSVCVLGMGTDGHTASLFPHSAQLDNALTLDNPVIAMEITAPSAPETRISLTLATLLSAQDIHILIHSPEKLTVLHQALKHLDESSDMPIRAVFQHAKRVTVHYAP